MVDGVLAEYTIVGGPKTGGEIALGDGAVEVAEVENGGDAVAGAETGDSVAGLDDFAGDVRAVRWDELVG